MKKGSYNDYNNIYCIHSKSKLIKNNIFFCEECGKIFTITNNSIMKINNLIKPKIFYKTLDISPLFILNQFYIIDNYFVEFKFPNFYSSIRKDKIKMIYSLQNNFNSSLRTLFYAINFMDKIFMSYNDKTIITEKKINKITISSYTLSHKFNEIDCKKYKIDYHYIFKKYDLKKNQIFKQEIKNLKILNYNLIQPDIYSYIKVILFSGFIFENELSKSINILTIYKKIYSLIDDYILDENLICKFSSKEIAFSILFFIRKRFDLNEEIFKNEILEKIFSINYDKISNCVTYLINKNINKDYKILNKLNIKIDPSKKNILLKKGKFRNHFHKLKLQNHIEYNPIKPIIKLVNSNKINFTQNSSQEDSNNNNIINENFHLKTQRDESERFKDKSAQVFEHILNRNDSSLNLLSFKFKKNEYSSDKENSFYNNYFTNNNNFLRNKIKKQKKFNESHRKTHSLVKIGNNSTLILYKNNNKKIGIKQFDFILPKLNK